jgi:threonine dehydratase
MTWLHRTTGMAVEGAGAVTVAALRHGHLQEPVGPIVALVSGRNVDPARLEKLAGQHPG